jgi:hypothetical protein
MKIKPELDVFKCSELGNEVVELLPQLQWVDGIYPTSQGQLNAIGIGDAIYKIVAKYIKEEAK